VNTKNGVEKSSSTPFSIDPQKANKNLPIIFHPMMRRFIFQIMLCFFQKIFSYFVFINMISSELEKESLR